MIGQICEICGICGKAWRQSWNLGQIVKTPAKSWEKDSWGFEENFVKKKKIMEFQLALFIKKKVCEIICVPQRKFQDKQIVKFRERL